METVSTATESRIRSVVLSRKTGFVTQRVYICGEFKNLKNIADINNEHFDIS
jgi:hypothetical protein